MRLWKLFRHAQSCRTNREKEDLGTDYLDLIRRRRDFLLLLLRDGEQHDSDVREFAVPRDDSQSSE